MVDKKKQFIGKLKKANINKDVIEHLKDTERKMKEKIPQAGKKKEKKEAK